jgi:LmbE family N-acetylglucosaminyl deacetylase
MIAIRKTESVNAVAHVDLKPVFLDFEDGRLIYDAPSYEKLKLTLEKLRSDVVFTHDPADYHSDHRVLSRMVGDAAPALVFYCATESGGCFRAGVLSRYLRGIRVKEKNNLRTAIAGLAGHYQNRRDPERVPRSAIEFSRRVALCRGLQAASKAKPGPRLRASAGSIRKIRTRQKISP